MSSYMVGRVSESAVSRSLTASRFARIGGRPRSSSITGGPRVELLLVDSVIAHGLQGDY